jgi:hypothetical protein
LGWRLRHVLVSKSELFTKPKIFTLTVDRHGTMAGCRGFGSPGEAHGHVTMKRLIPRLMDQLECKRWFWVLEFQKGDGWPHWHVLVDLASCPGGRLDLKTAWRWWRDQWGIGIIDLSLKGHSPKTQIHAVRYITKYLVKFPEGGFPVWVMNSHERIRFVGSSKSIGAVVRVGGDLPATPDDDEVEELVIEDDEHLRRVGWIAPGARPDPSFIGPCCTVVQIGGSQKQRSRQTHMERVLACGSSTMNLWRREGAAADGGQVHRWVGYVDATFDELQQMILVGWCPVGYIRVPPIEDDDKPCRAELVFPASLSAIDLQRWIDQWRRLGVDGQLRRRERSGVTRSESGDLEWAA